MPRPDATAFPTPRSKELLIGEKEPDISQHNGEPVKHGEVVKHVDNQEHDGREHLDKEALGQGVARIARRIAEDHIVGDNQVGQQDQRHHIRVKIHPLKGVVDQQHYKK